MELEKVITEVYDTANKSYGGYSAPARKDFVPQSTKNTANFPYQKQDDLTNPPPESIASIPWPLQTVVDDLADSFVFLSTAMDKMASCVKHNPSVRGDQKDELIKLYKLSKKALLAIRKVGSHLTGVVNIAGDQPSQNPVQGPEYKEPESDPIKNTIKIRVR